MPKPTNRTDHIGRLYSDYAAELERTVAARLRSDRGIVEDGCAFAWTTLLEREDIDPHAPSVRGWLYVTACREAVRLHRRARAQAAPEGPASMGSAPDAAVIALQRDRLRRLAELPERQRRILWRQVAGYSYDEIAEAEGITRTSTNKQIAKARRNLRKITGEGGENEPPDA